MVDRDVNICLFSDLILFKKISMLLNKHYYFFSLACVKELCSKGAIQLNSAITVCLHVTRNNVILKISAPLS